MLYSIAYRQRSGSLQFEHGDNNVCAKLLHCTTIIPELLLYMTVREKKHCMYIDMYTNPVCCTQDAISGRLYLAAVQLCS